jgi:hypothetical protein
VVGLEGPAVGGLQDIPVRHHLLDAVLLELALNPLHQVGTDESIQLAPLADVGAIGPALLRVVEELDLLLRRAVLPEVQDRRTLVDDGFRLEPPRSALSPPDPLSADPLSADLLSADRPPPEDRVLQIRVRP